MKSNQPCSPCSKKGSVLVALALVGCLAAIGMSRNASNVIGAASGTLVGSTTVATPKKSIRVARFPLPANTVASKSIAQVNVEPMLDLVAALERRGAKVQLSERELNGVSALHATIDGKPLTPWIKGHSLASVIVFEY